MLAWSADATDAARRRRHVTTVWWLGYIAAFGVGLVITVFGLTRIFQPFLGPALAILALLIVVWVLRPRAALCATVLLAMIGDLQLAPWYPFTKNLSSPESIMYLGDGATISPLDVSIVTGFVVTALRHYSRTGRFFARTPLHRPMLMFAGFVALGFVRGMTRYGDTRIAVLEGRPMLYIPLIFAIVTSQCRDARQLRPVLWSAVAGILVYCVLALNYLRDLAPEARAALERLGEHGGALTINVLLIVLVTSVLFTDVPRYVTVLLAVVLVPVLVIYLVAERRSAVASLGVAMVVVFIALYWRQRATFWKVVPVVTLLGLGYVLAFWSSTSIIGFPAQAIKGVVFPGGASLSDQQSDYYRVIENYDINFTIRASPLFGLGFGHPFYRPVPLPPIPDFPLAPYMPHNSFLWVWIKLGFAGFVATMYLFGKSLMMGATAVRRAGDGLDLVLVMFGPTYIAMYMTFTYVDLSWDARNTPLLGFAIAVCAIMALDDPPAAADADASRAEKVDATSRDLSLVDEHV